MNGSEKPTFNWRLRKRISVRDCQNAPIENTNKNINCGHSKRYLERHQSFQAPPSILKKIGSFRASRKPVIVPSIHPTTMQLSNLPFQTRMMRSIYPAFLHLKIKVIKTLRLRRVQNFFTTYQPPVVLQSMYTELKELN